MRGQRVVAAQMPWSGTAFGILKVSCGFAHDPVGRGGLAHFAEHLIAAGIQRNFGLRPNAVTDSLFTTFTLSVPGRDARRMCAAVASALGTLNASDEVMEAERQAILIETAKLEDHPMARLAPAAAGRSFPGCANFLTDRSHRAAIASISRREVQDFVDSIYSSSGWSLTIVSPQGVDETLHFVEEALAGVTLRARQAPPTGGRGVNVDLSGLPEVHLLAMRIAGGDPAARKITEQLLVGRGGLVDDASAGAGARPIGLAKLRCIAAEVVVAAWPRSDRIASGLAAAKKLFSEDESHIDAARRRYLDAVAYDTQTPARMASLLAAYAVGGGPWPDLTEIGATRPLDVQVAVRDAIKSASVWSISDGTMTRE
ncbi:hypothetical protein ACQP26_19670 [Micromonospora sp. CA-248089]|uniref:hypothetical protein n=1 Tax=Micromonospora sp. CA-248089 TaxID=3239960 RepID=UPI003D8CE71C